MQLQGCVLIKAVIFDFDGVLVHTNEFHYLAWKRVTERIGVPFDEAVNARLLGLSRADSLEVVLERSNKHFTPQQKQAFCDEKNEIYRSYLAQLSPKDVPCEVLPTLDCLREQGVKIAVGSSSKNARFLLERLLLTEKFHAIVDGTEVTHGKPNPEVFLKTAAKLAMQPQHCLIVEDSVAGVAAAATCGMMSAAVGYAAEQKRADFNMHSLAELPQIVQELNQR